MIEPTNPEPLLTAKEVARSFRMSTMTVYRLIRTGALSAIQIGRSYRVRPSAVEAYLRGRETR